MITIFKIILCLFLAGLVLVVGGGLLIAKIIDWMRAKKAKKEGLYVYKYPF